MRRKWFRIVFVITLVLCVAATNKRFDSLVEIAGIALAGSLLATTVLSLASVPIIWAISGKLNEDEPGDKT